MFGWLNRPRRGEIHVPHFLVRRDCDGLKMIGPDRFGVIQVHNWTELRRAWEAAGGVVRPYKG